MPLTSDADIRALLEDARTIALVGASNRPERDSHEVMGVLLDWGYRVIPVNPNLAGKTIHGVRVVADIAGIEERIDIVDIFRRSEEVPAIVNDAIAAGARAIWMQLGVINAPAAAHAEAAGLKVVMNRCPKIDLPRLHVARLK
ncbi:CoA-binding protein [Polymorphobacter arshaanensis]|uniref:CoA-binding protein n=1 Tax=Glacieibacterium arshaanense TaxID=2511025 RepID=A0A4Y9EPZ4_9SPHN|nr:CoA-binding protein [Polymorphobacter arshaanensis]TFU05676.1 CoA-binding protein [Polymorphobacter arshaanensis]